MSHAFRPICLAWFLCLTTGLLGAAVPLGVVPYNSLNNKSFAIANSGKIYQAGSVEAYGAKGDGVNNDTAAIQLALDRNDTVYFPNGTYRVSGTLVARSSQRIIGNGRGSVLVQTDSVGRGNILSFSGCTNFVVDSLSFQQLDILTGTDRGSCVAMSHCTNGVVRSCFASHYGLAGVYFDNSSYLTIEENTFEHALATTPTNVQNQVTDIFCSENSSRNVIRKNICASGSPGGIYIFSGDGKRSDFNLIEENIVRNHTSEGIILYNSTGLTDSHCYGNQIVNNIVEDIDGSFTDVSVGSTSKWYGIGIYLQTAEESLVMGNRVRNVGTQSEYTVFGFLGPAGICLRRGGGATISHNQIEDCPFYGIHVQDRELVFSGTNEVQVLANTIRRCGNGTSDGATWSRGGIIVAFTSNVHVGGGNEITACSPTGIQFYGAGTDQRPGNWTVDGPMISGCPTAFRTIFQTNWIVSNVRISGCTNGIVADNPSYTGRIEKNHVSGSTNGIVAYNPEILVNRNWLRDCAFGISHNYRQAIHGNIFKDCANMLTGTVAREGLFNGIIGIEPSDSAATIPEVMTILQRKQVGINDTNSDVTLSVHDDATSVIAVDSQDTNATSRIYFRERTTNLVASAQAINSNFATVARRGALEFYAYTGPITFFPQNVETLALSSGQGTLTGNLNLTGGLQFSGGNLWSLDSVTAGAETNLFLHYNGTAYVITSGTAGTTINATDNYIPKRENATTFTNSLISDDGAFVTVHGTGTSVLQLESDDGEIIFGSAGTNTLQRSGTNLKYINGYNEFTLDFQGPSGTASFGQTGGFPEVKASAGNSIWMRPNSGLGGNLLISDGTISPDLDNYFSFGTAASNGSFMDSYFKGHQHAVGTNDGSGNYGWLDLYSDNTNIVFNSVTAGTVPAVNGFQFQSNGVPVVTIGTDGSISNVGEMTVQSLVLPFKNAWAVTDGNSNLVAAAYTPQPSIASTNYTVATLPAGANSGDQIWCSDVLTPWGTGDRVEWNGSAWFTMRARIAATASLPQYMLNALASGWSGSTTISLVRHLDYLGGSSSDKFSLDGALWDDSTAGTVVSGSSAGRGYITFGTSTSSTTYRAPLGQKWTPAAGDVGQFAWEINLSALSDDTEKYTFLFGFTDTVGITDDAAVFLYDRPNFKTYLGAGYNTNNWWTVTRVGGANQTNDTGVAVTSGAWHRFVIQKTTTYDAFFIDGSMVKSNTTVSAASLYAPGIYYKKSAGTTERKFSADWMNAHVRYNTARTFWP